MMEDPVRQLYDLSIILLQYSTVPYLTISYWFALSIFNTISCVRTYAEEDDSDKKVTLNLFASSDIDLQKSPSYQDIDTWNDIY